MVDFKRTLGLAPDGDIYRDEQGKARLLDGALGVRQELKVTLATVEGEDPFNPEFGLDVFSAAGATDDVLKREIRLALQHDHEDRIKSIDSVTVDSFDKENRNTDVTVTLTLVDDTSIQLNEEVNV